MLHPLVDELAPLRVVLRRICPAGVDLVVRQPGPPLVLIRLGLHRQRLRHEADLRVRLHAAREVCVENPIDDRPVVDRLSLGIFGVDVGASPFQRRRAVAGDEQIVRAEIDLRSAELRRVRRAAFGRPSCSVVRLVGAEEPIDRLQLPEGLRRIDANRDGEGRLRPRTALTRDTGQRSVPTASLTVIREAARSPRRSPAGRDPTMPLDGTPRAPAGPLRGSTPHRSASFKEYSRSFCMSERWKCGA